MRYTLAPSSTKPFTERGRHGPMPGSGGTPKPLPRRREQGIGARMPRLGLLPCCVRTVTFIHDIDLEGHALLKPPAREPETARPRVEHEDRRKAPPQPGPRLLAGLSLKGGNGLRARVVP